MEVTYKLFEIQGVNENVDSLEFYSKIFMALPAYPKEALEKKYPNSSIETSELCDFMSDFVY
jgi:hypothetical protein